MTLSEMISHEWKTRLGWPAAPILLALFSATLTYGAITGRMERDQRLEAIAAHRENIAQAQEAWLNDLQELESKSVESSVPPWSGSAMDFTFASFLPPAPLGDFGIGQSDLLPYFGSVSLWDPDFRLFTKYELEDPVSLALGAFDLGKGILFLLPLLLIVLAFDILSSERDANRLGLILAQGARIRSIFWRRLSIRASIVLAVTCLISFFALMLQGGDRSLGERFPYFMVWVICALLYAAFWTALISFVASWNRRGEFNVMILLLAWAGFTLILPASATAIAEMVYPAPSRLAYLAETREMENDTQLREADVANQFILDHPDMLVDETSAIPAYVRTAFFVTSSVDNAIKPVLAAFEDAASKREKTLSVLGYISPTIITHNLFNDITGTSSARHRRYVAEARALKAAYAEIAGPTIVAGQRLASESFATIPRFDFRDEPLPTIFQRNAGGMLFLMLTTGLLVALSDRRLRRLRGPGG